jgi:hypothetical protein
MNAYQQSSLWRRTKRRLKARWAKLSDAELDSTKGQLMSIALLVNRHYGIDYEKAKIMAHYYMHHPRPRHS